MIIVSLLSSFLVGHSQEKPLDYFLQQGIKNSPLISDLKGQIHSSEVDSLLIKAINKPRIDFKGYAFYAPVINHFGYSEILTNIANLTSVMSVSKQVFNKKSVEANILKTGIQRQSLTNTIRLTENNLKKSITSAYLDVLSTWSDISVNRELLAFAREQEKILKSLTENGVYKQTDYLSFAIDLQGQELQLKELNLQLYKQISALYILCGIKDTSLFSPIKPELMTKTPVISVNLPLFQRFYLDSLRINNENFLIDRNYKPVVSWFSDAGLINNDPSVIYQNFGLSFGINFGLPVYDGNQKTLNHRKLKDEEEIRAAYASAFRKEYDQQLQQWKMEIHQIRALVPSVEAQVKSTELLVNKEKELVSRGSGSITDYLIAVKNYISMRRSLAQYEIRLLQITNEINYWN
jgi:outer membrane protein TolC